MGINIKPIVILSILLIGIIFLNFNFKLVATKSEQETTCSINYLLNSRNNDEFEWGEILPISEPVFGKNINKGVSRATSIATENDEIYVVWEDSSNFLGSGGSEIYYRYFNGNLWSDIQVISEPIQGQDINKGSTKFPDIAVEDGKIYVVWQDQNNTNGCGNNGETFFRCNLTGTGWEDIQVISEPIIGQNFSIGSTGIPKIAVNNDKIYVVWPGFNNTNGAGADLDIFYRCNLTGTDWEDIQVISEPVYGQNFDTANSAWPDITAENDKIYVTWTDGNNTNGAGTDGDIFYRYFDGNIWSSIQVISEPIFGQNLNTGDSYDGKIAVENDKIYVVWADKNDTNGCGGGWDVEIFYRCNVTGYSWEDIQVISEPIKGKDINTGISCQPCIAVEESGEIFVVWRDDNDTNGAGIDIDTFCRCNLSGLSWNPILIISEPIQGQDINKGNGFYPVIEVNNGKCHIAWNDCNNTTGSGEDLDLKYRCIQTQISPLFLRSPKVTPAIGNTSSEFNFTVKYFHLNNLSPTGVKVYLDEIGHLMQEVDSGDTDYIDGKEYFFKIKNLDIGTHTCIFWASNGTGTTTTSPKNFPKIINIPPKIITQDNLTAYEDTYYEMNYEFEDMDVPNIGQPISWDYTTNASWLKFVSNPPTLYGTPTNDDVGRYWVNIIINDTNDTDVTNFTLTVLDVNDNPEIVTNNIDLANEDEIYEVEYSATDIDSPIQNQIWSLKSNASSWLNFNIISCILKGTPTNDDVGEYWVNISVADGEGGADFTNYTLTVVNVNDPPSITTKDITIATVNEPYQVDYNASDIDSMMSNQRWSVNTNASSWLEINPETGILSGTPKISDVGWYYVNVSVNDGNDGSDWHEFILFVISGNTPPIITTIDMDSAEVNVLYSVDYDAIDDFTPNDELIWSLETNASWLSIDMLTGLLSGTPTETDIGWYWVNVSVHDSEYSWDHHNFTLTVFSKPLIINNPPILSNPKMKPSEGDTNTEFTFSIHYYDLDSEIPKYIQLVTGIGTYDMDLSSGEAANGIYECRIKLHEGEHNYYFTASDGITTVNSPRYSTPYIQKEEQAPAKSGSMGLILITAILVIVVLIVLFLIILNKRKKQKEEVPQEPVSAITTPEISTPVDSQTIPTPQDISIYTTSIPPELMDQPPIDTTPSITPSVIPTTSTPATDLPSAPPQALPPSAPLTTSPAPSQPESIQQVQPTQEQPQQQVLEEENKGEYEEVKNENED